jgi:hypothetical protein
MPPSPEPLRRNSFYLYRVRDSKPRQCTPARRRVAEFTRFHPTEFGMASWSMAERWLFNCALHHSFLRRSTGSGGYATDENPCHQGSCTSVSVAGPCPFCFVPRTNSDQVPNPLTPLDFT